MQRLDWERQRLPRRGLVVRWTRLFAGLSAATGCVGAGETSAMAWEQVQDDGTPGPEEGRLLARPGQPDGTASPGLHALQLDPNRDALLYVPAGYRPDQPGPLVVSLHGAGGNETSGLDRKSVV